MNIFRAGSLLQKRCFTVFIMVILIFVLYETSLLAQDLGFNPALRTEGTDSNIKSISAKYREGRVYLIVIFSGVKNDRYYAVKRSVDGNYYKTIGGIRCNGTAVTNELMCSYTDNYPEYSYIYYKVVYYTEDNDSVYSEIAGVLAGEDKSNLYVTIADDIWVINQKNDKMTPLKMDINTKETDCNATLSPDGKTLYFVSDRKGGYGGKDIWATEMYSNGQWSDPYNLGKEINSADDEDYPILLDDGVTLFFSKKSGKSEKSYDAYFSTQNDEGLWSEAEDIELLPNETKDYFSVISNSLTDLTYTYHVKKESAGEGFNAPPFQYNKQR